MQQQDAGYMRAAQAARGNILGSAPASAESLYLGNAGQQLLGQREGAAQTYLNGANPQSQFNSLGGIGSGTLANMGVNATTPWQYDQAPTNWGPAYAAAGQQSWQDANTNALAKAQAYSAAPVKSNPWIASLIGGFSALAGSGTAGGSSSTGGGGMGSMFGGSSSGSGAGYGGNYGSAFGSSSGGLGETASPSYL